MKLLQTLPTASLLSLMLCSPVLSSQEQERTNSDSTKTSLEGRVSGAALLTADGLQKIAETSQELQRSSLMIMSEVTRKDIVAVRGPNVLPNGIVIPAVPNPTGTMAFGNLDPRKKQLDRFVALTAYSVQLLQNEIDALILPEQMSQSSATTWVAIKTMMQQIQSHLPALRALAAGPKYDNRKIGKEALAIYSGAESINKLRKDLAATLPPPAK